MEPEDEVEVVVTLGSKCSVLSLVVFGERVGSRGGLEVGAGGITG